MGRSRKNPIDPNAPAAETGAPIYAPPGEQVSNQPSAEVSEGITADISLAAKTQTKEAGPPSAAEIARIRAMRKPFGAMTQKLAYPQRPGYHRHWTNDTPGRVDDMKERGWSHVIGKDSAPVKRVVGTGRDKGALYAYLLEIPQVFWGEDRMKERERSRAVMESLKKRPIQSRPGEAQASDQNKFYSPSGTDIVQVERN